jgi:MFS family permease
MPRLLAGMHRVQGLRFFLPPVGVQPLRLDLLRGPFGRFMAAYLLFYIFQYLPLPLFPVFNVRSLLLTDGEISLGAALFYLVMMLVSLLFGTGRLRMSYRSQLVSGGLLYGLFPLLMYLAQDARLYWVAMLQGGLVSALLNAGLINRLMERVPAGDRPAHMTLHNLALNLGILAGALTGPILAGAFGLREMMLISFGLRLVAGVVLILWG